MSNDNAYTPWITWINGKCVNTLNICSYDRKELSIRISYLSGDKELLRFGSEQEIVRAMGKLKQAIKEAVHADEKTVC